jgi:hypothetical protein
MPVEVQRARHCRFTLDGLRLSAAAGCDPTYGESWLPAAKRNSLTSACPDSRTDSSARRIDDRGIPVVARQPAPVLDRLVASGRATLVRPPGSRARMRPGDGTDRLSGTLGALRDEERWSGSTTPISAVIKLENTSRQRIYPRRRRS